MQNLGTGDPQLDRLLIMAAAAVMIVTAAAYTIFLRWRKKDLSRRH